MVVVECILCPYIPKGSLPPPPNIFRIMDFKNIWALLLQNGASTRKEEGTRRYWLTLSEEQQQIAYTNISRKLAEKAFVNYDPIRAIKENIWQAKGKRPTNYRGKNAPKEPIFSAQYNGEWGMYTQADIDAFHMEVYKE